MKSLPGRLFSVWLLAWLAMLLAACSEEGERQGGGNNQKNQNRFLPVVVSIAPLHSLASAVMEGAGQPVLLIKSGSPHHYALKPSDARALQNARLVIWTGPQIESFLAIPLRQLAAHAKIITMSKIPGIGSRSASPRHIEHEAGAARHHEHAVHGAHLWLDPGNAELLVMAISQELSRLDPAHAKLYQANARNTIKRLKELERQMARELAPVKTRPFITFHHAWDDFAARFGLKLAGALALSPQRPPGPRRIKQIISKIKTGHIGCIFSGPQFNPYLASMIARASGARLGQLDPLGQNIPPGPELYFTLMKNNARALHNCLASGPENRQGAD